MMQREVVNREEMNPSPSHGNADPWTVSFHGVLGWSVKWGMCCRSWGHSAEALGHMWLQVRASQLPVGLSFGSWLKRAVDLCLCSESHISCRSGLYLYFQLFLGAVWNRDSQLSCCYLLVVFSSDRALCALPPVQLHVHVSLPALYTTPDSVSSRLEQLKRHDA